MSSLSLVDLGSDDIIFFKRYCAKDTLRILKILCESNMDLEKIM